MPVWSNGGVSTFPRPTFALDTRWRGGQGLAREYSGEYVDKSCCTIWSAATCATRTPPDDVPTHFITTFLGERTPVVGHVGLRVREHTRALDVGPWTELSTEPGDRRPRGEAGRPPIGRPAWGWHPWLAGDDGEKAAISTGSRILTLLDEARVWLDFEGALGVGVSMASDLGVLGEDCKAMVVISEKEMKLRKRSGARLRNEEEEGAFRFKSTHHALNTQD